MTKARFGIGYKAIDSEVEAVEIGITRRLISRDAAVLVAVREAYSSLLRGNLFQQLVRTASDSSVTSRRNIAEGFDSMMMMLLGTIIS